MNVLGKIFGSVVFTLLALTTFSRGYDDKSKAEASCILGISSFSASPIGTSNCQQYQFNMVFFAQSNNPQVTINFGDGSPNASFSGPSSPLTTTHQYTAPGTYVVTATLSIGCGATTATLSVNVTCASPPCPTITSFTNTSSGNVTDPCVRGQFVVTLAGTTPGACYVASWNQGDGSPTFTTSVCAPGPATAAYFYPVSGPYTATVTITSGTCAVTATLTLNCGIPCIDCISSFAPVPTKTYVVSGWVKEDNPPQAKTNYSYPSITIQYPSISSSSGPFMPTGLIIDGWQRIEGIFVIPGTATDLKIKLDCSTGDCYFDDIRVFPYDGSMKSYVYDPVSMRLVAELDERNYATRYEYDEEGKLIRVKKETEKGAMTIQENRNNTKK